MELSDDEIQQIVDHFAATTGYFACPMCAGESASVGATVYTAPEFKPASNSSSGSNDVPLVAMV